MIKFYEDTLKKARETYGNKNQILVCMEELNELACVLAKYPRYESEDEATKELHDKVLDEVADVIIILDHVTAIFDLADTDIESRIKKKLNRLERWITHSDSMQETVDDRAVASTDYCSNCCRSPLSKIEYDNYCVHCLKTQATEGTAPYQLTGDEN